MSIGTSPKAVTKSIELVIFHKIGVSQLNMSKIRVSTTNFCNKPNLHFVWCNFMPKRYSQFGTGRDLPSRIALTHNGNVLCKRLK